MQGYVMKRLFAIMIWQWSWPSNDFFLWCQEILCKKSKFAFMSTGNKILFIFAPPPWRRDLLSLSEIVFWMMKEWGSGVNGKYCISWWHMMIGMVHFGFGDRCQCEKSYPVLSYAELVFHIVDHGDCIWIWSYQKIVYWWWKKCYTKFLPYCPVLSYAELVFP